MHTGLHITGPSWPLVHASQPASLAGDCCWRLRQDRPLVECGHVMMADQTAAPTTTLLFLRGRDIGGVLCSDRGVSVPALLRCKQVGSCASLIDGRCHASRPSLLGRHAARAAATEDRPPGLLLFPCPSRTSLSPSAYSVTH